MIILNTIACKENAIKKGKDLMNNTNDTQVNGKAVTEDLNYYFKIWLKKSKDSSNR